LQLIDGGIATHTTQGQNETIGDGWIWCDAFALEKEIIVCVEAEMGRINHHLQSMIASSHNGTAT
jgi:hypothetical protein